MPVIGTSHFVSRAAAVKYYAAYCDMPEALVSEKLAEGEIHIGPPATGEGEILVRIDHETRYGIKS